MTQEQSHEHSAFPKPPDPMTEPCSRFFRDFAELHSFFSAITDMAKKADEQAKVLGKFVVEWSEWKGEKPEPKHRRAIEHGADAVKTLTAHRRLVMEVLFCRAVDNYLAYVSEIMALIFRTKPETLKSNESMRLDDLLRHQTMDDLISTLVERRVNELSYQGMRDLSDHLSGRLGFDLFEQDDTLEKAVRIIELRNIIVHNRAVVNRRILSRLPDFTVKLGERLNLNPIDVFWDIDFLARSCSEIDGRAASKFGLPQPISGISLADLSPKP